jgi:hypothetical protein
MFSATIIFGPGLTPCTLNFRKLDDALKIKRGFDDAVEAENAILLITDDFGQHVSIARPFHACVVSDLNAQIEADIEKALVGARTQAKAQTAAGNDPVLRLGMTNGGMGYPGQRLG